MRTKGRRQSDNVIDLVKKKPSPFAGQASYMKRQSDLRSMKAKAASRNRDTASVKKRERLEAMAEMKNKARSRSRVPLKAKMNKAIDGLSKMSKRIPKITKPKK